MSSHGNGAVSGHNRTTGGPVPAAGAESAGGRGRWGRPAGAGGGRSGAAASRRRRGWRWWSAGARAGQGGWGGGRWGEGRRKKNGEEKQCSLATHERPLAAPKGAGLIARFLVETVKRLSWMVQEHGKLYSDQIIRMQGLSDATNGQHRVPSQLQR